MTLVLDNRKQSAVRRIMLAEPEPGTVLPPSAIRALTDLVGCDAFEVVEVDQSGWLMNAVTFPHQERDPQVCDGSLQPGLWHDATAAPDEQDAAWFGLRDMVRLGFRTPAGTVTQLCFDRRHHYFTATDIGVLTMMEPAIRRLVGSGAQATTTSLTDSERRVLTLVASGSSNQEVAEQLCVTVHTVRKHLEHSYRKLGVRNRTAAASAIRGTS